MFMTMLAQIAMARRLRHDLRFANLHHHAFAKPRIQQHSPKQRMQTHTSTVDVLCMAMCAQHSQHAVLVFAFKYILDIFEAVQSTIVVQKKRHTTQDQNCQITKTISIQKGIMRNCKCTKHCALSNNNNKWTIREYEHCAFFCEK